MPGRFLIRTVLVFGAVAPLAFASVHAQDDTALVFEKFKDRHSAFVRKFSGDEPYNGDRDRLKRRYTKSESATARAILSAELKAIGFRPEEIVEEQYTCKKSVFCTDDRRNISVVIPTNPSPENIELALRPKIVLIGAHFDTVENSPGADDNASGVSLLLNLAGALKAMPERNVEFRVVFFDDEERGGPRGMRGSRYAAQKLSVAGADLHSVHIFDMVGFDKDDPWGLDIHCADQELQDVYKTAIASTEALLGVTYSVALSRCNPEYIWTDYLSFRKDFFGIGWNDNAPGRAIAITEKDIVTSRQQPDSNTVFHTPDDVAAKLDYDYLTANTFVAIAAMQAISQRVAD